MTIPKDFREFIDVLNARAVEYVVVGGYALAFHGAPRFTGDIDFFVNPSEENAQRVVDALKDFGFPAADVNPKDFAVEERVFQIGVPPLRIDLLTSIDGVAWEEIVAVPAEMDGVMANFIGRDDLVRNKRASGRAKDRADLEALGE